jgi:hypothetical protein
MTANTGRTVSRWTAFLFSDGSNMRELPVDTINGVGLTYEEVELTAFMDAIKGALPNTPDCQIDISGPFDTTANSAHAVLSAANGAVTPRSLDVQVGIRHDWESGEPQFGITASSTSGFICTNYVVDVNTGKYTAKFRLVSGSSAPAWGTAAEAVS